jgi:hypothetical protein
MMTRQDPRIGTQLGKYRLVHRLGEGGMGVVYAADDPVLTRRVALKILSDDAEQAPGAEQRFLLEARAAARLHHPNVVSVYDIGRHAGVCYIVMELVNGTSAQAEVARLGGLPWPRATRIIADVCRGLAAAHAAGLIHRDIKPANILIGRDGVAKLTDFGIARAPQLGSANPTLSGTVLGTPHYMSPEQCTGDIIDARADLYALGCTYHTLLTGRPPYDGTDPMKVMFAHCAAPVPDPISRVPGVPEACAAVVRKALAKNRADRFRSAGDMLDSLTAVLATLPPDPNPDPPTVPLPLPVPIPADETEADRPLVLTVSPPRTVPRRRRIVLGVAALAGVAILAAGIVALGPYRVHSQPEESPKASVAPEELRIRVGQRITLGPRITLGTHEGPAHGLAFGGRRFASVGADKGIRVWDLDHLKTPTRVIPHNTELHCVALSPGGEWLAAGKREGETVSLWDAATGAELGTIRDASGPWSLAFHPSGRRLAIGSGNRLQVIDLDPDGKETGRKVLEAAPGEIWAVTGVAFTPDGKHLGVAAFSPGALFLDADSLKRIDTFAIPRDIQLFAGLSISPDGTRIAVARKYDQRPLHELLIWEPTTGHPPRLVTSEQDGAVISGVAFAPGGRQVAHAGTHAGPVKLLDLESGESVAYPTGDNGNTNALAFSPDGRYLAATGSRGKVLLWEVLPVGGWDK